MISKSPAFQFYPAEFLADANVALMSNQELGCYMKLLCYCWREGSVPNDIRKLARLCGEDSAAMAELWEAIKVCFKSATNEPSQLLHPRLEVERKKQTIFKKERSKSGKKGAQARWDGASRGLKNRNSANGSAIAQPLVEPMAKNASSSSSLSSTSSLSNGREINTNDYTSVTKTPFPTSLPPEAASVRTIFEFWKTTLKHSQAKLDANRSALIRSALKLGYTESEICEAITGCSLTPHNIGDNERGQRYDGLHVILRSADQIDRFIGNCRSPPAPRPKETAGQPVTQRRSLTDDNFDNKHYIQTPFDEITWFKQK